MYLLIAVPKTTCADGSLQEMSSQQSVKKKLAAIGFAKDDDPAEQMDESID